MSKRRIKVDGYLVGYDLELHPDGQTVNVRVRMIDPENLELPNGPFKTERDAIGWILSDLDQEIESLVGTYTELRKEMGLPMDPDFDWFGSAMGTYNPTIIPQTCENAPKSAQD